MADGDVRELDPSDVREIEQELLRRELLVANTASILQRFGLSTEGVLRSSN
jgi:hypothetical protein